MSAAAGPDIPMGDAHVVVNLNSDASFNTNMYRDHMLSKWYAFRSATVRYAIVAEGTTLYEEDSSGNVTTLISSTTSEVTSGSISVTQGKYYYGNGPVCFFAQGNHSVIGPISLAGNYFWTNINRYTTVTLYVHAPFADASVSLYREGSGVDGTAESTMSISKGEANKYFSLTVNSNYYVKSDTPVIVSRHAGGDRQVLTPMVQGEYIYIRDSRWEKTISNSAPGTSHAYYVKDDNKPAMTEDYGDGGGGDSDVGVPASYLSNTYVIPEDITSYFIVAPNTNTVDVEYWSGSSWTNYNTHTYTGTGSSPGATSVGAQSGSGAELVSASNHTWRFKGTDVFYVCINDSSDDEEALFGYMRSEATTTETERLDYISRINFRARSANVLRNAVKTRDDSVESALVTDHTNITVDSNGVNYVEFDSDRPSVVKMPNTDVSGNWTVSSWVYLIAHTADTHILTSEAGEGNFACKIDSSTYKPFFYTTSSGSIASTGTALSLNTWYNIVYTYDGSTLSIYVDGRLRTSASVTLSLSQQDMIVNGGNSEYNSFRFSKLSVFNKAYPRKRIRRMFAAFRKLYK